MLDRQKGGLIVVECDTCGDVLDTETKEFDEARDCMQRNAWKVRKVGRDWIHGCPGCGVPREGSML